MLLQTDHMSRKLFWVLVLLIPVIGQAQFKNLINKAKAKVDQRIDSKVDKAMDKQLDKIESKPTVNNQTTVVNNQTTPIQQEEPEKKVTVHSYSKFDFVPGEQILYVEDFAQDAIGELPLTWNSSGKGEVMTIDGQKGQWLRLSENTTYLSGNQHSFGENYTIEFDAMYFFDPKVKGYILPNWSFGLFTSGGLEPTDNSFLKERSAINSVAVNFGYGGNLRSEVESHKSNAQTFRSDLISLWKQEEDWNRMAHFSVQVQKSRLRVWINETKVFDIPRAINTSDTLNQLFFKMDASNYKDDEVGIFLSNIKVATGLPDTRHKLIEEGKFSTTGILFAVNSANIKPESNGVLKEIADALKADSGIKVKIIGHTDSDGSDAANLELSKKRAEAVKNSLVSDFGIDASVLETDGRGESQPVADNKTKEGKAQNRRVEFVKM